MWLLYLRVTMYSYTAVMYATSLQVYEKNWSSSKVCIVHFTLFNYCMFSFWEFVKVIIINIVIVLVTMVFIIWPVISYQHEKELWCVFTCNVNSTLNYCLSTMGCRYISDVIFLSSLDLHKINDLFKIYIVF